VALCRFTVAALAFSPFLKEAFSNKRIWRGGLELGFWMALGAHLLIQSSWGFGVVVIFAPARYSETFPLIYMAVMSRSLGRKELQLLCFRDAVDTGLHRQTAA
jgi:hypothetical protein